jgi:hypothetical protein
VLRPSLARAALISGQRPPGTSLAVTAFEDLMLAKGCGISSRRMVWPSPAAMQTTDALFQALLAHQPCTVDARRLRESQSHNEHEMQHARAI